MKINRSAMTKKERQARSRLAKIAHELGIIRGSLMEATRTCGKEGCKCLLKDEQHKIIYISQVKDRKGRSIYVSEANKSLSEEWIKNYKEAKELLETISEECIKRFKAKRKKGY